MIQICNLKGKASSESLETLIELNSSRVMELCTATLPFCMALSQSLADVQLYCCSHYYFVFLNFVSGDLTLAVNPEHDSYGLVHMESDQGPGLEVSDFRDCTASELFDW